MIETIGTYTLTVTTTGEDHRYSGRWTIASAGPASAARREEDTVGPFPTEVAAREAAREAGRARIDGLLSGKR